MLDILEFIFGSFWRWLGFVILVSAPFQSAANVIRAWCNNGKR